MDPEYEAKRRNYIIAGAVGGFILPLAGLIGALVFLQQDDRVGARIVAAASALGIVAYLLIFTVL